MIQLPGTQNENGQDASMMPMVDVIFTLIAFMMLIINAPQLSLEMDLPKSSAEQIASHEEKSITLSISSQRESWKIDSGSELNREQTKQQLKLISSQHKEAPVTLLAMEKDTPAQRIIDTLELLSEINISDTRILLEDRNP